MWSPSRTPLPPPSLPDSSGSLMHQAWALVSWIQPGLVICFTLDNIHVSMLFSWNIPPSPSLTESKLFQLFVYLFGFLFISVRSHIYLSYTLGYDLVFCYCIVKIVSYLTLGFFFFSWLHNHCRIWSFWVFLSFLAQEVSPSLYIPMSKSLNQPLFIRVLVPFIVEWY